MILINGSAAKILNTNLTLLATLPAFSVKSLANYFIAQPAENYLQDRMTSQAICSSGQVSNVSKSSSPETRSWQSGAIVALCCVRQINTKLSATNRCKCLASTRTPSGPRGLGPPPPTTTRFL